MRLIDADAFVPDIASFDGDDWHYGYSEKQIANAPTIDAVEVVHGEWIMYPISDGMNQCSKCGVLRFGESNFCPNCGAKMDGERREK